jgi:hypothetical protein
MSASTIWAWIFLILFVIVGIYAINEHNAVSAANTQVTNLQAELSGAAGGTQAPMIPASTSTTTGTTGASY